jgi:hypothetical protein
MVPARGQNRHLLNMVKNQSITNHAFIRKLSLLTQVPYLKEDLDYDRDCIGSL